MDENQVLKIFMLPQEFPCGEQSSCCGPIGQSEEQIQSLKSSIEEELGYEVEVLNVKNEDHVKNHPQVLQLVQSLGPAALPILTLSDEVVSIGKCKPQEALLTIRMQTEKIKSGKENEMVENDNFNETRQENLGAPQACCPSASASGDCCSPTSSGAGKKWKTAVFLIIVVAAGVVLARSLIRKSNSISDQSQQSFATIEPVGKSDTPSTLNVTAKVETPTESKSEIKSPSVENGKAEMEVSNETTSSLWGQPLDSLASLNKVAAETDVVFILLGAEDKQNMQPITKQIEAAAKKVQSNGVRVSAFTLKKDAPNYAQLAKQLSIPCVLAMVKGRGMSGVSGDITETKLVQAFVMASRPSSGCCPPGTSCGPAGPKK